MLKLLDPRSKLMMMLCLSTPAIFFTRIPVLLGILLFCLLLLLAGGAPVGLFLRRIRPLLVLVLMLFVLQCAFIRSGEPLFSIGGLPIVTRDGMEMAVCVILRMLVVIFSAMLLASGQTRDYLLALTQCHVPYEIAFMVMAAVHFIPLLRQDAADVFCAAQMRGTELKKIPLRRKIPLGIRLVMPILASAQDRVWHMSIAMEARAFRAFPRRTSHRSLRLGVWDKVVLTLFPAGTALLFIFLR